MKFGVLCSSTPALAFVVGLSVSANLIARPLLAQSGPALDRVALFGALESGDFSAALPLLQRSAEAGDAHSLFLLGLMQSLGAGMPMDSSAASDKFAAAAGLGSRAAARWMLQTTEQDDVRRPQWHATATTFTRQREPIPASLAIDTGEAIVPLVEESIRWNRQAAEAGTGSAWYALAHLVLMQRGSRDPDFAEHRGLLQAAGEAGVAEAWAELALYATFGLRGEPVNSAQATRYREAAAEAGHAVSQFIVGRDLVEGRTRDGEPGSGFAFLEKAAAQGEVSALHYLAKRLRDGNGVERDDQRAVRLFERGLELNHNESREDLAWMLQQGRGTARDLERAARLYEQAADAGSAWARLRLALMVERGDGVAKDPVRALALLREAAENGSSQAMREMGQRYADGNLVEKNDETAFEWFEAAAQKGNAWSQNRVGWMLQNGIGVEQDVDEALVWYRLAADKGEVVAAENLTNVYARGAGNVKADPVLMLDWWFRAHALGSKRGPAPLFNERTLTDRDLERSRQAIARLEERLDEIRPEQRGLAALSLARIYLRHSPINRDRAKALGYFDLASSLGAPDAAIEKALSHLVPLPGDPARPELAFAAVKQAALEGNPRAELEYIRLLNTGPAGLKDPSEARRRYTALSEAAKEELARRISRATTRPPSKDPIDADIADRISKLGKSGQSRSAVPVYRAPVTFPPIVSILGLGGTATVNVHIDTQGKVTQAELEAADWPHLTEAALESARRWRFAPAIENGEPVLSVESIPIRFIP